MSQSVLLQAPSTHETRTVRSAALLLDGIDIHSCPFEGLGSHAAALAAGGMLPVGSVEFVREAMKAAGISEPEGVGFPAVLQPWYHREIRKSRAGSVLGQWFVKPVKTKLFTGFVFDTMENPSHLDDHDRQQYDAFMTMAPDDLVWISPPVRFLSEWRYYVQDGRILGSARYDPLGAEDAPAPDLAVIGDVIQAWGCDTPYGLDMGVLDTGETAIVEIHGAWALGLYGSALDPRTYYQFLRSFWTSLLVRPAARRQFA